VRGSASGTEGVRRMRRDGAGCRRAHPPLHRGLAGVLGRIRAALGEGSLRLPLYAPPAHRGRLLRPAFRRSPQSIRSVAVHLVGLHLQLERETPTDGLYAARQRIASLGKEGKLFLAWLDPPKFLGEATVLWALEAEDAEGYGKVARVWAESVWEAWSAYHDLVHLWAAR
jgi:hypothetical protein